MKNFLRYVYRLYFPLPAVKQSVVSDAPITLKSVRYDFRITYVSPFRKIASLETENKTVMGFIDDRDGKSLTIKFVKDLSEKTDEEYMVDVLHQQLKANQHNQFLGESNVNFLDNDFTELVFLMETEKWGLLKQHAYFSRKDGVMYSFQMAFPVDEMDSKITEFPEELKTLLDTIELRF